jgi:hypothetical protein
MSSISIDYIVYCRKLSCKYHFRGSQRRLRRSSVIPFFQKTWFLWWILAALIILRWFHLFSVRMEDEAREAPDAGEEKASAA